MSSAADLHSADKLQKLIDQLTRQDLANRVAELEVANTELQLRLDAIARLSTDEESDRS